MARRRPKDPKTMRARLWNEQGGRCCWCGELMDRNSRRPDGQPGAAYPSFEHVRARRDGGDTSPANLRLAHLRCNQKRGYFGRTDLHNAARE